jgi:hypothetical protein
MNTRQSQKIEAPLAPSDHPSAMGAMPPEREQLTGHQVFDQHKYKHTGNAQ